MKAKHNKTNTYCFQSTSSGVSRQASQTSLLEQFAAQAKELVRETTRQGSQEGLLAHMDKVIVTLTLIYNKMLFIHEGSKVLKSLFSNLFRSIFCLNKYILYLYLI